VIGFEGAFHGRTYMSLALTSKTHPYKAGLGPFAPEVYRVPFNDLDALRGAFRTLVAAEDVAAIVFEPVQGEGGFIPATRDFAHGLREICDEHGIVLVCDEVQTGFARTGRFFAVEHLEIEPDLITVAKSIAMGLPLSGVLGKAEIMDAPVAGGVGGTYVGNPVAQAAALAVLDVIEDEGLVERSAALGETMRSRMESWQARFAAVTDARGLGAMLAIELETAELASKVVKEALSRGLLLLKAGVRGNCIRVLVPLVISDAELDEALDVWEASLEAAL
jgi:4-aminobutyrate aminotransferase